MNADHFARLGVTEALNACTRWTYGAELLAPVLAAYRVACVAVAEADVTPDTRAALEPFLDRVAKALGLEQLEQLELWPGRLPAWSRARAA